MQRQVDVMLQRCAGNYEQQRPVSRPRGAVTPCSSTRAAAVDRDGGRRQGGRQDSASAVTPSCCNSALLPPLPHEEEEKHHLTAGRRLRFSMGSLFNQGGAVDPGIQEWQRQQWWSDLFFS